MYGSYGSFDNPFSGLVCVVAKHGILLNILSENIIGVQRHVANVIGGLKLSITPLSAMAYSMGI